MMQVNVSVPQDQLAAAVRAEVGALFAGLLGAKAPKADAPAPARKRVAAAATPAPAAPAAKEQGTKAPKAKGVKEASASAPPKGTNADAVLSAVKGGADTTDAIATKTGLDKGQINSALAVLKRNGQVHSPSRGSYAV